MRLRTLAFVALALGIASCADQAMTGPGGRSRPLFDHTAGHPSVRFSEIHYDNVSTDAGEAIEISGPAGTDLTGWSIVLYNGAATSLATYNTATLSGTIPATCDQRGVVVQTYPVNGIQNGDPDGFALVNAGGQVVEFLSYGGTFTAANGPAAGMLSTDLGVKESGTTPLGFSLQRDANGVWQAPAASTFGACNDGTTNPPPVEVASVTVAPASATISVGATQAFIATAFDAANQPIAGVVFSWSSSAAAVATVDGAGTATGTGAGDATITAAAPNGVSAGASLHVDAAPPPGLPPVRVSELHYDNFGTDANEAIEVEGPAGTDLAGWSLVLYNGNGGAAYHTRPLSGVLADQCGGRGVVVLTYPQDGIQNGSPDGLALVDAGGQVVEFLSYEGVFTAADGPAAGRLSTDIGVAESSSPVGQSLQRDASGAWQAPAANTFGACNGGGGPPPPPTFSFTFSGRDPVGDPPLPVGFQDQLFVTVRDGGGVVVTTPVIWTSETPALAGVDQAGVVTALGAGTATLRATLEDNSASATFSIPTAVATAGGTAQYAGNAEFGEPADGDPSDDFIVRRDQYTLSYSAVRNTPNWVAYEFDASHFGAQDRCDCFTFDPALPAGYTRYTTADYTGSGAFHGYGIDRGHLARSFDRTTGSLDNAFTFYFSNIIPQAADLNQGPWAAMETYLGDLARFQNKEVYVIAGVAGTKGTLKDLGIITIPSTVWKVAVIMPRDRGLADVHAAQDIQVIAVIMPNNPGVRNVDWHTYETTVDAVEALSGYDLLALLPDQVEIAVESGTSPPVAVLDGPYASDEGSAVAMSAAGSSDPDGDALTFSWTFGDGGSATGATVSHSYAQNGVYTVTLVATDARGLVSTATATATVANVAPLIGAFAGATLLPGETYAAAGMFADPGADGWSATVDYGDGSGTAALPLAGMAFTLSHGYAAAGSFTVTVRVADGDATSSRTATVTVWTAVQGVDRALDLVSELEASGALRRGGAALLTATLRVARRQVVRMHDRASEAVIEAAIRELDLIVRLGRLSAADAEPLRSLLVRILAAVR